MPGESAAPSRKDRKRAEIVRIAGDLFLREGYAAASMSQIAAALGGSKTTLYNHFQSKEELLFAVVADIAAPSPTDYDMAAAPQDFRAWLGWFGRATLRKIVSERHVALQRLAAGEAARVPEIGRILYDVVMSPNAAGVMARFEAAMAAGDLRRADTGYAVEHFLELCFGLLLRRVVWNIQPPPSDAEIAGNVDRAVAAFLEGYAPRAAT